MLRVGPSAQEQILAAAKANLEAGDWVTPTPPAILKLSGRRTLRSHYDPNQPRDPGGEGGGRWVKTPGMGAPSVKTGPGRGPAGKLRNFEQMGDVKLAALMAEVISGDDQEAKLAILAAAKKRGWASAKALPPKGTAGPSPAPKVAAPAAPAGVEPPTISGHDVNSAPPMRFEQAPLADVPKYVADPNIVFQQKIDGIRAQLELGQGTPRFRSSSGKPLVSSTAVQTTGPILEALPDYQGPPLVVDGEVLGGTFHVFDLIVPGQENRPYLERQAMADAWVKAAAIPGVKALPTARTSADKQQLYDKVYANGGEGVMMKRADSPYTPGKRVKHTLKAKFRSTVDAVIMERDRDGHSNFVLGLHDENGVLQEIGTSSAIGKPDGQVGDVIEVAYLYAMPGTNSIVQPSVVKLRPDKQPEDATVGQLRFVNKDVLDAEALSFASSAELPPAGEPELPPAGELPPAELEAPEPPDLGGWQKGDVVEHPTAGRATVIGPAPASKPGYINVSPESRAGHSYWRTENLKAPQNWLGEPMRMSGIQREGFPPTPIAMLVTTGQLDMERFASPALGRLLVPDMQDGAPRTEKGGIPFAADNGGFWGVDEPKYKALCQKLHDQGVHPLWVTVPDVLLHSYHAGDQQIWAANADEAASAADVPVASVTLGDEPPHGDWKRTAQRFEQWQPYLAHLGLPAALVAQDGLDSPQGLAWLEQRWDKFEALFIGGSDDFKLGPGAAKLVKLAHEHGKLVHVGRVNTAMRVSYARDVLQADSLDGQAWAKWKDKKLPGGLAYAPSGDPPPTAIGKAWITAAHEAQQNGGPWPRPPGHIKPIWPAGTFAQAPATVTFQDVSDALYRVGLSDYEHLHFTADEPGFSVELTDPRQAGWLAAELGVSAAMVSDGRASWPVLIVPEDEDAAGVTALGQEPTTLGWRDAWRLQPRDPGGEHGGEWVKSHGFEGLPARKVRVAEAMWSDNPIAAAAALGALAAHDPDYIRILRILQRDSDPWKRHDLGVDAFEGAPDPHAPPSALQARREQQVRDAAREAAAAQLAQELRTALYNPSQPRDPGGEDGGQWVSGGGPHPGQAVLPVFTSTAVETFHSVAEDEWYAEQRKKYGGDFDAAKAERGWRLERARQKDARTAQLTQELTLLLRGGNTYHDPGGLHGGQFAKKGALDEGTSAKPARERGGSGTTPGAGGGTRPPEDSAVAGAPRDGGPSAAASVTPDTWEQQLLADGIPQDHEVAAVFRDGKLVSEVKGGETDVGADSEAGDVISHTHPTIDNIPTIALSDADVRTAAMHDAAEIRAVNAWGVTSLAMADGSNLDWRTVNEWNDDAKIAGKDHRSEIDGTKADALAKQEEVRLATAEKFGLAYTVTAHESTGKSAGKSTGKSPEIPPGLRPATAEDRHRLKVPPAWTDVQVNPDPKAGLQAVGKDRKGRHVSIYSAEHHTQAAKTKFAHLRALHERMPAIVAQIEQDAEDNNQDAIAALLIQRTGLRPGSTKDTGADEQAYGASTLKDEHVTLDGDTVGLKFTGKKGVAIDLTVEDATLANVLRERLDEDPGGDLFQTDDAKLRAYLSGVQEGLRPKDFRTYLATATAYQMASETPPPTDEATFKHVRKQVGTRVSKLLGNTPEVALASYIDPAVFDPWAALLGIRAQEAEGV